MTPAALAELVQARPTGRTRWQAKCPAHTDHSPSLSIQEGREGRVLVRCWAGCELPAILAVLKLSVRDLFAGEPPSPRQMAALAHEREAEVLAARDARRIEADARSRVWRLEAIVNALGAKLARIPDDADEGGEMTRLFHVASDRLHAAEVDLEKVQRPVASGPMKGAASNA